ncbi:hypothetical protein V493_00661 [Pseudogymnoascus sp. VKM F-4281 (FW-2241)]|nr:hypothetical protein V493_00661 [Pseudogymnoascus sp. VKM F-4281 (FW-2241)]
MKPIPAATPCSPQNRDIPQVPQNHKNVHISKRQLIDKSRLLTDPIISNSVYVQAILDSTFPVQVRRPPPNCSELAETTGHDQIHQGVEKPIVDEMRPSPLRERAGGSCDRGTVCDIEDDLQQTSAEAGGSPPSRAAHSQYNQMDQESQNNTDVRGTSSEERVWEKTIEQQHCQQQAQEDEDEDDREATSSDNKGPPTGLRISCKEVAASTAEAEKAWAPRIYGARRQ